MDTLTRFELRKIIRSKLFYVVIAIVIAVVLLLANMRVTGAYITGKDGEELKGLAAISLQREYGRQLAGPLTTEKLENSIERHKKAHLDPNNIDDKGNLKNEAYAKYEVPDEQINTLIRYAFSPLSNYDYSVMDRLQPDDAKMFYEKRIEKVNGYLNYDYSYGNYSVKEKAFFNTMNEQLRVPFQMDYVTGWEKVFQNLQNLFLIISLAIGICLAPMFADEYQRGTDAIILSSRYGRNKVITAKLKAGFILSIALLLLALVAYTLLLLGIFGFEGAKANVQMIDLLAPVSFTVFQAYLWAILIGSLACLMVGALTLWLSSLMSSPFSVIIVIGILVIGPLFIPASKSSRLFNHLIDLLPGNMFGGFKKITSYELFNLFGVLIPEYKVMAGFALVVIVLLLPLTYRAFKKHQVA
ncbi:ABC transporter permease subunit [Paenibacillus sp. FSL F4-0243]|uniref:ABC transporter permease subunit n=1 Tax=Paenibacillus sp. FSL F4-0243 TaxID=2954732 RepID=UPI0030D89FCF